MSSSSAIFFGWRGKNNKNKNIYKKMIFNSIYIQWNEYNINIFSSSLKHSLTQHNTSQSRAEQKYQPIPHKNLFHIVVVVVSNPRVYCTYAFSADCSNCPTAQDTTQRYTQSQAQALVVFTSLPFLFLIFLMWIHYGDLSQAIHSFIHLFYLYTISSSTYTNTFIEWVAWMNDFIFVSFNTPYIFPRKLLLIGENIFTVEIMILYQTVITLFYVLLWVVRISLFMEEAEEFLSFCFFFFKPMLL